MVVVTKTPQEETNVAKASKRVADMIRYCKETETYEFCIARLQKRFRITVEPIKPETMKTEDGKLWQRIG
jgi:hypothetical protein